jgi:hypothetical protein
MDTTSNSPTFDIEIVSPFFKAGTRQVWTWFGRRVDKSGSKILHNHKNYASDTTLLLNSEDQVVDGYSLLVNGQTKLTVTPMKLKDE